jgi:hypothetical protein
MTDALAQFFVGRWSTNGDPNFGIGTFLARGAGLVDQGYSQ